MIKSNALERRRKRKKSIRKKVVGTPERPRLSIYRSAKHIYAQIIDDLSGRTLVSASTLSKEIRDELKSGGSKMDVCKMVGAFAAKRALEKNIRQVVYDRNGLLYHGRVKAVADGAREAGLKF